MADKPIAELFAKLGFKVDFKELKTFEVALDQVEKKLKTFGGTWSSTVTKAQAAILKQQQALKKELQIEQARLKVAREKLRNDLASAKIKTEEARASIASGKAQAALAKAEKELEKAITEEHVRQLKTQNQQFNQEQRLHNQKIKHLRDERREEQRTAGLRQQQRRAEEAHNARLLTQTERQRYLAARTANVGRPRGSSPRAGVGGFGGALLGAGLTGARVFTPGIPGLMAGGGALAGAGIGLYGLKQVANRGQELYGLQQGFTSVFGGQAEGQGAFENFMRKSDETGIGFRENAKDYMNLSSDFRNTGLGEYTDEVFFSFAELGLVMGRNKDQMNRAFRAISQIASKGQLMSEELKQQ